jgi:hypothetical protein
VRIGSLFRFPSHSLCTRENAILSLSQGTGKEMDDMNSSGKSATHRIRSAKLGSMLVVTVWAILVFPFHAYPADPGKSESAVLPNGKTLHVPPAGVVFCKKHYRGGLKGALSSKLERLFWDAHTSMYKREYLIAIDSFTTYLETFKSPKERAIYKTKEMADFMLGRAYQGRGYCYLMLKQYQSGINDLNQSIKYRPDYQESYLNRAEAYKLLGRKELADRDFEQASHMRPHKLPDFIEQAHVVPIQDTPVVGSPD